MVEISAKEMPVSDFLRLLSAKYSIALMWSEGMDKRLVSIEAAGVPLDEVLTGMARRFAVSLERVGRSWYVGEFRNEDRAYLVRKTSRLSKEALLAAVQVVLTDAGRAQVFEDGLLVCSDRSENLRRVVAVLEDVEAARSDAWVIQLFLLSTTKSATRELGVDTQALVDLSYTFAKDSIASVVSPVSIPNGVHLASKFDAVLRASASRDDVKLLGKPLFLVSDGQTSKLTSGLKVPIARKTVSDQGTVETAGYDYIQSGFESEVKIREGGNGTVFLSLNLSMGQITGYVESAPIQSQDQFNTVVCLASSGVYLLGALDRDEYRSGASGIMEPLLLKRQTEKRASQLQIWARLYRVEGPALKPDSFSRAEVVR